MELIGALAAGLAAFAALMAALPSRAQPTVGLGQRVRAAYARPGRGARGRSSGGRASRSRHGATSPSRS